MDTQINDSSTNDTAQLRATNDAPLAGEGTGALAAAPCSARLVVTSSGSIYNLDHIVSIFPSAFVKDSNFWAYMTSGGIIHSMANQDAEDVRSYIRQVLAGTSLDEQTCNPFSAVEALNHLSEQSQMLRPFRVKKSPESPTQQSHQV